MVSYNFYQYRTKYEGHFTEETKENLSELKQCKSCQKALLADLYIFLEALFRGTNTMVIWTHQQDKTWWPHIIFISILQNMVGILLRPLRKIYQNWNSANHARKHFWQINNFTFRDCLNKKIIWLDAQGNNLDFYIFIII